MSNESKPISTDTAVNHGSTEEHSSNRFARTRWFQVLAVADQLRRNTALQKNEQLRKYAFDLPPLDAHSKLVPASLEAQTHDVERFQNELLSSKTGNFSLDTLTDKFIDLKETFNRMLLVEDHNVQQINLATTITRTALLMVQRAIELSVDILTKRTRHFPSINSLISFIRSCPDQLPIHGQLLVDWYSSAQVLDLLINDQDWLVQPRKAHWAMHVCNETLAWSRAMFNQTRASKATKRAIFDRDDSFVLPESQQT